MKNLLLLSFWLPLALNCSSAQFAKNSTNTISNNKLKQKWQQNASTNTKTIELNQNVWLATTTTTATILDEMRQQEETNKNANDTTGLVVSENNKITDSIYFAITALQPTTTTTINNSVVALMKSLNIKENITLIKTETRSFLSIRKK
jgi:hypothetical protein